MSVNSSSSPHGTSPIPRTSAESESTLTSEELAEQRSQWLSRLLSENPQLLALRERVLPWTGGYSFANVVHTDTTSVLSHVNRHVILELVYQHLNAIGMHRTAEMLQNESGHEFQMVDQPWDKTDLLLLVSLGVLPREDPWTIAPDPHHQFVEESLEEDFFASPYREDPNLIWQELLNPDLNVVYFNDSEHSFTNLKAASLKRFVVILATASADMMADDELTKFFLTLHSITSSYHFFEHLLALFDCHKLNPDTEEQRQQLLEKQPQLRINVINLIKKWTNFHGLFIGRKTLKSIGQFLRRINDDPESYQNVAKFVPPILDLLPKLSYGMKQGILPPPTELPEIPDEQIIFKPTLKITEPSPLEVARQITLLFQTAFKAVHSREFVVALGDQRVSHQTPTLAEFFDFGDRLTLLVLETVVNAPNGEYPATVQKILDIATHLKELGNYDALACVLRALYNDELNTPAIWTTNATMRNNMLKLWDQCGDNKAKLAQYNDTIARRFDMWEATIPNLRVELVSVPTDKSPSFVDKLINWEKRRGISEKTSVLYRFQNKAYNYSPIPQIQHVVNAGPQLTEKAVKEKIELIRRNLNK